MRVLSLFSGAGGSSEGYRQAGFEITAAVDSWWVALQTHHANHPGAEMILSKVEAWVPKGEIEIDLLEASPPCPEFSPARYNNPLLPRPSYNPNLIEAAEKIIEVLKPRFWVIENVPGMKRVRPKAEILDARRFGMLQRRKRAFLANFKLPAGVDFEDPGIPTISGEHGLGGRGGFDAFNNYLHSIKDGERKVTIPTIVGAKNGIAQYRIPRQKLAKAWHEVLVQLKNGSLKATIPTIQGSSHGHHNDYIRPLNSWWTTRFPTLPTWFMKWAQGFPDNYHFLGRSQDQRQMIVNAVPPPVARAIGEAVKVQW